MAICGPQNGGGGRYADCVKEPPGTLLFDVKPEIALK